MTLFEVIAAIIIMGIFLFGFSQAFMPALDAWRTAMESYSNTRAMAFVAHSFRAEVAKPNRNLEYWENMISTFTELEFFEVTEYWQDNVLRALRGSFIIAGEFFEVIGLCTP